MTKLYKIYFKGRIDCVDENEIDALEQALGILMRRVADFQIRRIEEGEYEGD